MAKSQSKTTKNVTNLPVKIKGSRSASALHDTSIDIGSNVRGQMVGMMNQSLADMTDLMLRTKEAHWNIRGSNFIALHKFFDELNALASEQVDELAERITALAGRAEGRLHEIASRSSLPEYPQTSDETEHLQALATTFAKMGKEARECIDKADEAEDADTADLYTAISRFLDKSLWMIEAHIKA